MKLKKLYSCLIIIRTFIGRKWPNLGKNLRKKVKRLSSESKNLNKNTVYGATEI